MACNYPDSRRGLEQVAEDLRLIADSVMGHGSAFRALVFAEHTIRLALAGGWARADDNARAHFEATDAAAEAADRRADAEARLAELAADGEGLEAEDRVAAGIGSRCDLARVVSDAMEGERFRIASAACDALAAMILGGIDLPEADRAAIVRATRADWTARDRT